jgi:fructosamine-3-kinase
MNLQLLKELLSQQLNSPVGSIGLDSIAGGSINDSYRLTLDHTRPYFLKLNSATKFPQLFEKEKTGLCFLAARNCILTPAVIFTGTADNYQLLLLEWIEQGIRNGNFWQKFGEQLAHLHLVSQDDFGFTEDNYMGSLVQVNKPTATWADFFVNCRLRPQLEQAAANKLLQKSHIASFESLFKKITSLFGIETPSLLHGDLWSGNFMCNKSSLPVLIDPAVYFGHRSMDLAMTTLFGGFDRGFYDSYNYHFPFPINYHEQWEVCNLYPLLIHLNLFGSTYLYDMERTLKKFS